MNLISYSNELDIKEFVSVRRLTSVGEAESGLRRGGNDSNGGSGCN